MRKVFENIADQWLALDNALDRSGALYYTTAERAARTAILTRQIRLGNILRKAAKQERRRIEAKEGKKPWPPMLRWPFDLAE